MCVSLVFLSIKVDHLPCFSGGWDWQSGSEIIVITFVHVTVLSSGTSHASGCWVPGIADLCFGSNRLISIKSCVPPAHFPVETNLIKPWSENHQMFSPINDNKASREDHIQLAWQLIRRLGIAVVMFLPPPLTPGGGCADEEEQVPSPPNEKHHLIHHLPGTHQRPLEEL